MITTIIDDKHKEYNIVTKQYELSAYVIINNNPFRQFSVNMNEVKYHKWLRKYNNWIPDESSVIK